MCTHPCSRKKRVVDRETSPAIALGTQAQAEKESRQERQQPDDEVCHQHPLVGGEAHITRQQERRR